MKKKTVIILACHRSGNKMIGNCLLDGDIKLGYAAIAGGINKWSLPRYAQWVLNNGTVGGENPLLNVEYGSHNLNTKPKPLYQYLNDPEDTNIVLTTEISGEHRLHMLNDIVLGLNDRHTSNNPAVSDTDHATLNKLTRALIKEYNKCFDYWGFKDPRMIFTWEFWKRAFNEFDNKLKLVFLYRNPLSVAHGAMHYIGGEKSYRVESKPEWPNQEKVFEFWNKYNRQMLHIMDEPYDKIVVKYDAFFDGDDEVKLLDAFLDLEGKLKNPADPSKRHFDPSSHEIPSECKEIWEELERKREEINSSLFVAVP